MIERLVMARFLKNTSSKIGQPPGSLIFTGERSEGKVKVTAFGYGEHVWEEKEISSFKEIIACKEQYPNIWVNIDGLQDTALIEQICNHFQVHALTIEDILHPEQRPKVEEGEGYIYVVLKMLQYEGKDKMVNAEQVSVILGSNFVLSFQERPGDTFESVRNRLRGGKGRIRRSGADYLMYALIDTIVDHYFLVLERVGDLLEDVEEVLMTHSPKSTLHTLYTLKREMLAIRKVVWPLREVIYKLEREEYKLIKKSTHIYLRDIYDHVIQVIDTVETIRDMLASMFDLYQSTLSNRMNAIMKVLTIISTIFIPLTFIAGVYGMNFQYMPELDWRYGYPAVWGLMLMIVLGMFVFFKRKGWL